MWILECYTKIVVAKANGRKQTTEHYKRPCLLWCFVYLSHNLKLRLCRFWQPCGKNSSIIYRVSLILFCYFFCQKYYDVFLPSLVNDILFSSSLLNLQNVIRILILHKTQIACTFYFAWITIQVPRGNWIMTILLLHKIQIQNCGKAGLYCITFGTIWYFGELG